jgi:hypothetical protein
MECGYWEKYKHIESTSYRIEVWYDRYQKLWMVEVIDQVGRLKDTETCWSKEQKNSSVERYKEKYVPNEVKTVYSVKRNKGE